MAKKSSPRDPNLDHPAVKLYIDICRSTPNHFQRELIVAAIIDLELYGEILKKFMAEGRPPQRVDWTIERYRNQMSDVGCQRSVEPANSDISHLTSDISPEEEAWMKTRTRLSQG